MKLSFIIPALNEERVIAATLASLKVLKSLPYEIIVSDGESTDRTVSIARRYADRVVSPKATRHTIPAGKNKGAEVATGDYFIFMDADVWIPDPDTFFSRLLVHFEKDPSLVAATVAIRVDPKYATLADKIFFALLNLTYFIFNNIFHIGGACGEFQMIRASAFRKIHGYREDLPAGEDNDLFNRLSKSRSSPVGKTRSYLDFTVFHSGRRAHKVGWPKLLFMWMKNGLSMLLFNKSAYKKWPEVR